MHRFAELGSTGVLALFADSTNIDRRGFTGSELEVVDAFEEIFTSAPGQLVVAAFSSSIYRMQILVDLAAQFDRKVAFVGRGMIRNSEIAQRLGYLRIPAGVQIRDSDVGSYPAQDVLCLCTGSQGEPMSALSRIAIDDHRHVKLGPDDTVVLSARSIPGNEKAIGRVINHLARRGADVIHEGIKHVHVSGHGSEEELKLMLSLVRPRYFVPVHGEYRQLVAARAHRRSGCSPDASPGPTILLAENGDVLHFDDARRAHRRQGAGRPRADRRHAHRRSRRRGAPRSAAPRRGRPGRARRRDQQADRRARGRARDHHARLRHGRQRGAARRRARGCSREVVEQASVEERTDQGLIKEKLRVELRRFFRKRSGRRPFVLPVIMEI